MLRYDRICCDVIGYDVICCDMIGYDVMWCGHNLMEKSSDEKERDRERKIMMMLYAPVDGGESET